MKQTRLDKINVLVGNEIANILNYKLKDPRKTGIISVLRVETDASLKKSDVYVSILCDNEEQKQKTWQIIKASASFVRKSLASKIDLRVIPFVNFILDSSIEYSEKINNILNKINLPEDSEE